MTPKSQKFLCTAALNGFQTDVYTVSYESGGWFFFNPCGTDRPRLKIGTAHNDWWAVLMPKLASAWNRRHRRR